MEYRILVTTSGGGNAQNLIRSLRGSDLECYIIGTNADKFELAKSNADKNYLLPRYSSPYYLCNLYNLVQKEKIDFVIPNHEYEIKEIVESVTYYKLLADKLFLPKEDVVNLCVDKFELVNFLKNRSIENVATSHIYSHFKFMPNLDFPLWIRLTKGSGSRGAMLVSDSDELKFWIDFWVKHNGVTEDDFMVSEYLPGKDHHYFSLWKDGEMIVGKAIERIRYCCSKYTLTGTSSSPSLCKAVLRPDLDELTKKIITTIDPKAQGLYGIDYKQSRDGKDCLTEINIGRFPRINYIFNLGSLPNIAELYVKCGLGKELKVKKHIKLPEELYFIRDFDTPPILKTSSEIERYYEI